MLVEEMTSAVNAVYPSASRQRASSNEKTKRMATSVSCKGIPSASE